MNAASRFAGNSSRASALAAAVMAGNAAPAQAQRTVLEAWDHPWCYLVPYTGSLPQGSGITEPNAGPVKWYAPQADFEAGYEGPSFCDPWYEPFGGRAYVSGTGPGPLGYGEVGYMNRQGALDYTSTSGFWNDLGTDFPAAASPSSLTSSGPLSIGMPGGPPRLFLRVRVRN